MMLSNGKVAKMPDRKLTDKEIVKALRSWLEEIRKSRQAYLEKVNEEHYPSMRYEYLLSDTIHEINRLQAENERLKNILICFMGALGKVRNIDDIESISQIPIMTELNKGIRAEIKSEGYKEFAELLRLAIVNKPSEFKASQATVDFLNGSAHRQQEILDEIELTLKELVGEDDA